MQRENLNRSVVNSAPAATSSCDSALVLVVDDDDSIRETLRFALEEEGYHVLDAADGAAALASMRQTPQPLVVLLDHLLGDTDGVSVLRELAVDQALAERHAYLLVTASARATDLEQEVASVGVGPVTLIRKPFDLDALFSAVREASMRVRTRN